MAKMEQALILDPPSELHFKVPSTDITTSYINLTNPTTREICFKVKTTAPKTYCVRPNGGTVPPKKTVKVAVMLQPFDVESSEKTRHKFMVQSIYAPDGEYSFDNLWRDTPQESFMNSKLKCVFDTPAETPQATDTQPPEEVEPIKVVESKAAPPLQETPTIKRPESDTDVVQKLLSTQRRLQNELNELRQDNSALKEEGLRSRVAYDTRSRGTSAKPVETELHQRPAKQLIDLSSHNLALFAFIFLLGIYLGKFIF